MQLGDTLGFSRVHFGLPAMAKADSIEFAVSFQFHMPAFVWPGKQIAAHDPDGCTGDNVMWIMRP
jgi:hypothetical protein